VPEIHSGTVEIKAIAREPGSRSKVAVASRQEGLDPVGATVGQRGARVQAVVAELGGEKIDVIPWNDDAGVFVANALSPAQVISVDIDEEHRIANVTVPERMLSLAIGREGQNARLAARLTGWRIDIRSDVSVAGKAAEDGRRGGDAETPRPPTVEATAAKRRRTARSPRGAERRPRRHRRRPGTREGEGPRRLTRTPTPGQAEGQDDEGQGRQGRRGHGDAGRRAGGSCSGGPRHPPRRVGRRRRRPRSTPRRAHRSPASGRRRPPGPHPDVRDLPDHPGQA
jgi:transcription antitermination factor NusA-like protein